MDWLPATSHDETRFGAWAPAHTYGQKVSLLERERSNPELCTVGQEKSRGWDEKIYRAQTQVPLPSFEQEGHF